MIKKIITVTIIILSLVTICFSVKNFPQDYTQDEIEEAIQGYINQPARINHITWMSEMDKRIFSYSKNPFINQSFYITS